MSRAIALAVLAGVLSSALFLSLVSGLPFMILPAYFVQLPLLFIGLSMGLGASLLAALGAIVVNAVIAGLMAAVIYALLQALPALVIVRQALLSRSSPDGQVEWYPPGLMLIQMTGLAVAGIGLAFLIFLGEPGGLSGAVEAFVTEALTEMNAISADAPPPPGLSGWISLLPGLMAASWLVMAVVNGAIAQAFAVRVGWNRRPSPEFAGLELPSWLWWPLAGAIILAVIGGTQLGFLGRSITMVLMVPYIFLGLAVIHTLARRWNHRGLVLTALYAAIVLLGWPLIVVLLLGFVEDWAKLRQRFA